MPRNILCRKARENNNIGLAHQNCVSANGKISYLSKYHVLTLWCKIDLCTYAILL